MMQDAQLIPLQPHQAFALAEAFNITLPREAGQTVQIPDTKLWVIRLPWQFVGKRLIENNFYLVVTDDPKASNVLAVCI